MQVDRCGHLELNRRAPAAGPDRRESERRGSGCSPNRKAIAVLYNAKKTSRGVEKAWHPVRRATSSLRRLFLLEGSFAMKQKEQTHALPSRSASDCSPQAASCTAYGCKGPHSRINEATNLNDVHASFRQVDNLLVLDLQRRLIEASRPHHHAHLPQSLRDLRNEAEVVRHDRNTTASIVSTAPNQKRRRRALQNS